MKWTLLRPLTAWRKHRAHKLPINRDVWAAQHYSGPMRRFYFANKGTDILTDVELPEAAVVLDIGAFEGGWSRRLLAREWLRNRTDVRIHAFEPEPSAADLYRKNLAGEQRVEVHPFGLSGSRRRVQLSLAGPGSSVFANPQFAEEPPSVEVELRDVDEVLRSLQVDRVDLAKINIEGGEFELLDRLHETGWLPRITTLMIQFHEFAPDAYRLRRRNRRQLAATHRCSWNYPWVYERWDRTAPSSRVTR